MSFKDELIFCSCLCLYWPWPFSALCSAFKSEYISVLEEKDLRVSDFVSLCNNWKGAMMFNCFVPPKVQSAAVYDRDNLTKYIYIYIYKLYIKSVWNISWEVVFFFFFLGGCRHLKRKSIETFFYSVFYFHLSDNFITV